MRTLLFRGQTRRYGEKLKNFSGDPMPSNWVYGGIFHQNNGGGDYSIIYSYDPIEKHVVYADTVGQYTGVEDENDTPIYEGDIVKAKINGIYTICTVNWAAIPAQFQLWQKDTLKNTPTNLGFGNYPLFVIGNIYDNPELLKFESMGWDIEKSKYSGHADRFHRGKEGLHLHPMLFSGVILEESIPEIEKALSKTKIFQWYHTDTYARYFEMSDSEYLLYLSNKRDEMIQDILQEYQTKRRNLFITSDGVLQKVQKKYHLCRVGDKNSSDAILTGVLDNLFSMLLARGDLLQSPTRYGIGYRTATEKDKKEQKTA